MSLSHTRGQVAAAAAWLPCGIDVELIRPVQPIRSALAPGEEMWLSQQPDVGAAFLRLWVRKEAMVKAGLGGLGELHRLDALRPPPAIEISDWSSADAVGAFAVVTERDAAGQPDRASWAS